MGNKRQRKIDKKYEDYSNTAVIFMLSINTLYVVSHGYAIYFNNYEMTNWEYIGFGFFTLISYFMYTTILNAIQNEYGYDYYNDIFIINLFTQFCVSFSSYGWYIYLLVPGYLLYILGGFVWPYISQPNVADDEPELTKAELKKLEKKRKKDEKPKVKYSKH